MLQGEEDTSDHFYRSTIETLAASDESQSLKIRRKL